MAKPNDKQPSQLTQDAVAATQTGLSYGYYIAQRRAKQQAAKTPQKRILTCIQCGLKFICYTKREQKFCSTSCKKKYLNAHKHDAAKMAALNNLPTKICPICQTEFPLVDTRMKYCSKECAAVPNRARSAKKQSPKKTQCKRENAMNALHMQRFSLFLEYMRHLYEDCLNDKTPSPMELAHLFTDYTSDCDHSLWLDIYPAENEAQTPIGFLIIGFPPNCHPDADYYIQEAYINQEYRQRGHMRATVNSFLAAHPGTYCLFIMRGNEKAYLFWEHIFRNNQYVPCCLSDIGAADECCTQYGFQPKPQ